MFGPFKKYFGKRVYKVASADDLKREIRVLERQRDDWKGQANVDATECLSLKKKLRTIREVLGKDDEVFSKYTRSQIEDMELEEFIKIEHLIDQDVADGKLFLQ